MLEQSKKISSYTDFWRHHCLQTLLLLFRFVASETIEQSTNQRASGWHININRWRQRGYRYMEVSVFSTQIARNETNNREN